MTFEEEGVPQVIRSKQCKSGEGGSMKDQGNRIRSPLESWPFSPFPSRTNFSILFFTSLCPVLPSNLPEFLVKV